MLLSAGINSQLHCTCSLCSVLFLCVLFGFIFSFYGLPTCRCLFRSFLSLHLTSELSAKTPSEALVTKFYEGLRKVPAILFLPHADNWWANADELLRQTLIDLLSDVDPTIPLFFFATCDTIDKNGNFYF